jgi:hypothetical protein
VFTISDHHCANQATETAARDRKWPGVNRAGGIRMKNSAVNSSGLKNTPSASGTVLPAIPGAAPIRVQSRPYAWIDARFATELT